MGVRLYPRNRAGIEPGQWLLDQAGIQKHLTQVEQSLRPLVHAAYQQFWQTLNTHDAKPRTFDTGHGTAYSAYKNIAVAGDISDTYLAIGKNHQCYVIKVLKGLSTADDELLARLQRERNLGARLQQSDIVQAIDGNKHFLVFPFIPGVDLQTYINRQSGAGFPIPPDHAFTILHRIAEALRAAYNQEGMIHRDIKPSNIHLGCDQSDRARVRLLDLGIAKWLNSTDEPITSPGTIMGTYRYMAPEMLTGRLECFDEKIDIFSLGVLFATMVQPNIQRSGKIQDIIDWANDKNRPTYTPEQLAAFGPSWISDPIRKMTERDPLMRCGTYEEVLKFCAIGLYQYVKWRQSQQA